MDLIPLNWSKMPETQYIFKILSICFGPYNTSGNLEVNTADIFDQIHEIASSVYIQSFGKEDGVEGRYIEKPRHGQANQDAHP